MMGVAGQPFQIGPFAAAHRYALFLGQGNYLGDAVVTAAGLHKKLKSPAVSTQGLTDRVDTIQDVVTHTVPFTISSTIKSAACTGSTALAIGRPITR